MGGGPISKVVGATGGSEALQVQPPRVDEFVPVDQLPPDEQLPAAPLLMIAYAIVWLMVVAYLYSMWRRLGQVERELHDVARRAADRDRRS